MNIKKHIPNAITCGNLLCGCLAIVKAFEGNLVWAAYLVGIAAVLDFFDGFAARTLKVSSAIGKDLDSLADMVTFGVVPGVVMFQLINSVGILSQSSEDYYDKIFFLGYIGAIKYMAYFSFMIPIFSAIRLAKFNNDVRQSDSFIGVPTPANAIFILSLGLIFVKIFMKQYNLEAAQDGSIYFLVKLFNPFALCLLTLILSLLLVAEFPLFALKFKHFKWKDNEIRFVFLGLSLVLLITLQFVGIPLIIILYILMSVINNLKVKSSKS